MRLLLLAASAALLALPAQAQTQLASYSDNTSTDADGTYDQPFKSLGGELCEPWGNGPQPYDLEEFSTDVSGSYDFLSVQDYDGYMALFEGSFDPNDPCASAVVTNDDFPSVGQSGFSNVPLNAGTSYFLATSAFCCGEAGSFTNTISGPEGATVTLLGGGGGEPAVVTLAVTPLDTDIVGNEKATFSVTVTNNGEQDYTGSLTVSIDGTPVRVNTGVVRDGTSRTYTYRLNFTSLPDGVYGVSFTIASAELGGDVETEGPFLVFKGEGEEGPGERSEPFAATVQRLKAAGDVKALKATMAARAALVSQVGVEQGTRRVSPTQAAEVQ